MSSFNKQQLSKISPLTITMGLLFAAIMTYLLIRAFAASGTATLYTSPGGTQSVTTGQTFAVSVRVSSAANVPVTGAAVYLSYPTAKLQVIGESYSGSPYNTELVTSDSGGVLRMDRAAFPLVSGGDQLFAQVTFKAIASGSAPLSFTGSSIVTSGEDDSNILGQKNGVTYNVVTPETPPPPSSGGGSSGGGTSSGSSGSSSGSGSSSSRPTTTSGSSSKAQPSSSQPSAGTPGTSSQTTTGTSAKPNPPQANGQLPASSSYLSTLQITIVDSHNKPVEGAEVTIDGQTVKTDKNGVAHFDSIPSGDQVVAVKYNGKKTSKVLQVKGAATQITPELFKVSIIRNKFNPAVLLVPVAVLLVAGGLILRPWDARFAARFAKAPTGQTDIDQIVTSSQPHETPQTLTSPTPHKLETPGTVYTPSSSGDEKQPPKE